MDALVCTRCHFSHEFLLVTPCCSSRFCESCLTTTGRCFKCFKVFDIAGCVRFEPTSRIVSENLVTCRHAGCKHVTDALLIKQHEEQCDLAPLTSVTDLIDDSMKDDFVRRGPEVKDRRRQNMLVSYKNAVATSVPGDGFISHLVLPTDTIVGLSLRYSVSQTDIRKANNISPGLKVQSRTTLRIPAKDTKEQDVGSKEMEEHIQKRLLVKFKKQTGTKSDEEALYYLEETLWHYEKAVAMCAEDDSWTAATPCS
eukprot:TRINITY_DN11225_c0_g1_i1.p1 TRINITY_DN11225_c0_g1~~TRINITY_DN11225_c0_g1_i1.p1  ORF type:complete len:255 (+),score=46.00 TRINITY_DN11225_c0_g1_i1:206-970(+)